MKGEKNFRHFHSRKRLSYVQATISVTGKIISSLAYFSLSFQTTFKLKLNQIVGRT